MIDHRDGSLRILRVSDELPWNLSQALPFQVFVDLLCESALPSNSEAGGRDHQPCGQRARDEPS
jgi:hypothetical protein